MSSASDLGLTQDEIDEFQSTFGKADRQRRGGGFMDRVKGWINDYADVLQEHVTDPIRDRIGGQEPEDEPWSGVSEIIADKERARQGEAPAAAFSGAFQGTDRADNFARFWASLSEEDQDMLREIEENNPDVASAIEANMDAGDYETAIRQINALLLR